MDNCARLADSCSWPERDRAPVHRLAATQAWSGLMEGQKMQEAPSTTGNARPAVLANVANGNGRPAASEQTDNKIRSSI